MNDEIVGIAIWTTDRNPSDGCGYLFVMCSSPSRKTIQTCAIPIYLDGTTNPGNRGWKYRERGEFLDVSPSLKMSIPVDFDKPNGAQKELFHNAVAWSVRYARRSMAEASDALRELNAELCNNLRASWVLPIPQFFNDLCPTTASRTRCLAYSRYGQLKFPCSSRTLMATRLVLPFGLPTA